MLEQLLFEPRPLQAGDGGQALLIKLQSTEEKWTEPGGAVDGGVADLAMRGPGMPGESGSS